MTEWSQEQKGRIAEELRKRGASLPCPRCGNHDFVVLDGYINQLLSTEVGTIVLGGQTVPSIVTGCSRCGYLSQHALGVLGFLSAGKEKKADE